MNEGKQFAIRVGDICLHTGSRKEFTLAQAVKDSMMNGRKFNELNINIHVYEHGYTVSDDAIETIFFHHDDDLSLPSSMGYNQRSIIRSKCPSYINAIEDAFGTQLYTIYLHDDGILEFFMPVNDSIWHPRNEDDE